MTTPALEALNNIFPAAKIDIVSDYRSDILYRHCPYRGEVFLKHKKKFLRGSLELLTEVRRNHYDLIVDLRTDGLAYLCKGNERMTKWQRKPYGTHAVEQLMGVIWKIHGDKTIPAAKIWTTDEEHRFAEQILSSLPGDKWLVIVPGNANTKKVWPVENYTALINSFADSFTGVIFEGSWQEKQYADEICAQINLPYVNLAGRTNLLQAAAVINKASLFVGSDSGLGHIAGAVSTPSLIFFSVDKPERVLPWGGKADWLISPDEYTRNIPAVDAITKARGIVSTA